MSLVSAHQLVKQYGAHRILSGTSVTLSAGERVGLVGNNGSGKSTLARILAGIETADEGVVMLARGARVGYLAQVPDLDETKTAFEVASSGLKRWSEVRAEFDKISEALTQAGADAQASTALLERQATLSIEFDHLGGWEQVHKVKSLLEHLSVPDPDALVSLLSGGEKRRIALAQLLVSQPDLLILDEPTNHLDTESIDWLEQYLSEELHGALLLITHDRYFLDRLVQRTLELSRGELRSYEGGWESYLLAKAERELLEDRTESNRQNFLRKEVEWLRRQPKARGTKQKARTARAEDALKNGPPDATRDVLLQVKATRQGSSVLELRELSYGFDKRTLIDQLDLTMVRGQRIGIIGRNGTGKTSLLRILMGELSPTGGSAVLGKNSKVTYFDQMRSDLDPDKTILENVAGKRDKLKLGDQELTVYSYLERFLFRSEDIRKKVGMLSGGERARVALAKLLLEETNLLLLDEPTNDLDVATLSSLEELLQTFAGCVVVVTHDRYFLNRVATDLLVFEGAGKVTHYVGNYDTYLAAKEAKKAAVQAAAAQDKALEKLGTASSPPALPKGKRGPKLSYKEQQELSGIESAVETAESNIRQLEGTLADPNVYREGPAHVTALQKQLAAAQARLQQVMDRWEELESKREAAENGT